METVQRLYKDIITFYTGAEMWLRMNPGKTKFHHAMSRTLKKSADVVSQYNEQLEDISIEHASVDKDGNVLKEEGNEKEYKYTPKNKVARNKKRRELFNSKTSMEVYYASEVPEDLNPLERELFTGFVIREEEPAEETRGAVEADEAKAAEA